MTSPVITIDDLFSAAQSKDLARVHELAAQLAPQLEQACTQFAAESEDNPELTAQQCVALEEALDDYRAAVDELSRADEQQLEPLAQRALQCREQIRASRQQHADRFNQGPALLPYLNRLLTHLEAFAAGQGHSRHTIALLEEYPAFRTGLTGALERIETPESRAVVERALDDVAEECRLWADGLKKGESGGDRAEFASVFREETMRLSDTLVAELGMQLERELGQGGPTEVAWVNLVFSTGRRLADGKASADDFRRSLEQCRRGLREKIDSVYKELILTDAVDQVCEILDRLGELGETPAALEPEWPFLEAAGHNLAMFLTAVSEEGGEEVDLVSSDGLTASEREGALPLAFESLLSLGDAYCAGRATREEMEAGLGILESLAEKHHTTPPARMNAEQQALHAQLLERIDEGLEVMQGLLDSQDRFALDKARAVFTPAADLMRRIG
ncbi:MAG: hypothetical protein AB7S38_28175 [Vulcanimicrobiota bacterium]